MRFYERLLLSACVHSWWFRIHSRFTVSLLQGSRKIRIPLIQGLGWDLLNPVVGSHFSDIQIREVVSKLYDEGRRGCFVDVGANQGRMIVHLLALGVNLSYLGFEPQLEGAYYIQELIRRNKLKGHHIVAVGLGSADFLATFYRHYRADVSATYEFTGYSPQGYSEMILAPISTADAQLATLENDIFLVKIDTEGSELNVLQGMNRILREKRPPVYFEVMGYRDLVEGTYSHERTAGELPESERQRLIKHRQNNMENLGRFWRERGYTTFLCREDGPLLQVQSLDPGPQSEYNRSEMNYLALPL
jgi:FkbM family methyltransferase